MEPQRRHKATTYVISYPPMIAEKPAASYSYTGGVKETTGSNPRLRDITDPCRGIRWIFLASIKSPQMVSTCDRLVSETLGSQPFNPMIGESRWLVTAEPVEFEISYAAASLLRRQQLTCCRGLGYNLTGWVWDIFGDLQAVFFLVSA